MINILLESSQKQPLLKLGRSNPFENGLGRIKRQFRASNVNIILCQEPLRGMLTQMCKKFGILGALAIAVGILGAPHFRHFGSPKIRKTGSASKIYVVIHNRTPYEVVRTILRRIKLLFSHQSNGTNRTQM